jgi:hypothetical protein
MSIPAVSVVTNRARFRNKSVKIRLATAAAWLILSSSLASAQLYDPNNQCVYQPGSTICQPVTPVAPPPPPPAPMVNQCEANCSAQQQQCMATCTAQHDWYRCFAFCGDGRTVCLRGCPM